MKAKIISLMVMVLACTSLNAREWGPADPEATPEAKALFQRLLDLQKKGTMYGHQDDLMTGRTS